MYSRCEILFPHRSVGALKDLGEDEWRKLVERISALPETHEDSLAFSLMMIRLCNCLNCDLGSYKASLGCTACSRRAIGAIIKTGDKTLLRHFQAARREMLDYLHKIGAARDKAA
jgi:hypothetical protein